MFLLYTCTRIYRNQWYLVTTSIVELYEGLLNNCQPLLRSEREGKMLPSVQNLITCSGHCRGSIRSVELELYSLAICVDTKDCL